MIIIMQAANKIAQVWVAARGFTIIRMDIIYGIPYKDPGTGSIISVGAVVQATRGFSIDEAGHSIVAMVSSICSSHVPNTSSHLPLQVE